MKVSSLLLVVVSVAAAVMAGCATAPAGSLGGLLSKRETIVTNQAPVAVITQQAVPVVHSNGVIVTNYTTLTNFETRTVCVTNTVWQTAAGTQEVLATVNAAAPFIPAPFGSALAFGSSVAAVLLGAIAKRKSDHNASLAGQLEAVVRGVEKASAVLPEGNQIKKTIDAVATKMNVATALDRTVQGLT